jgi:hypothetical protein
MASLSFIEFKEDEWSNFGLGINHYYAVEGKHFGDDDYV